MAEIICRVRPGQKYGPNDLYHEGDLVTLDEGSALQNRDKLEVLPQATPAPSPALPHRQETAIGEGETPPKGEGKRRRR